MRRLFKSVFQWPPRLLSSNKPTVTVVDLQGAIGAGMRPGRGLSARGIDKALVKAFKNKNAKAVVLAINSPGGSPAQARMISDRIRHLSLEKQVPVLSYIEDVGASGGYMIAVAGEEILADPYAIVGSIGVISAGFGFQDAIAKLGVERRVNTAGTNKMRLDPFQEQKDEDREKLKALLDDTHQLFIEMVKDRRGDRITGDPERVFSGDFFLAAEAKELGLIDEVGDMRAILRRRYGNDVDIQEVNAKPGGLLAMLGSSLVSGFVDDLSAKWETEALRGRFGR